MGKISEISDRRSGGKRRLGGAGVNLLRFFVGKGVAPSRILLWRDVAAIPPLLAGRNAPALRSG
jgi:hypothetical protein